MAAAADAVEVVLLYGDASVPWRGTDGSPMRWADVSRMDVALLHAAVVASGLVCGSALHFAYHVVTSDVAPATAENEVKGICTASSRAGGLELPTYIRIAARAAAPFPASAAGGASGASFDQLAEAIRAQSVEIRAQYVEIRALRETFALGDVVTEESDVEYEERVRAQLPSILLHRCGLEVPDGVTEFHRASLGGQEWDFRTPVLVTTGAPAGASAETDEFVVFESKPAYVRPARPSVRHLKPETYSGAAAPPLAHYLAIFEITTSEKWTHPRGGKPGLLQRLETRLRLCFERARHTDVSISSITDVVAVVGVVAPSPYTASVRHHMANRGAPPFLRQMMNAGRFVFIRVHNVCLTA